MKNNIDLRTLRQFELIGYQTQASQNLVRPKKTRGKFEGTPEGNRQSRRKPSTAGKVVI